MVKKNAVLFSVAGVLVLVVGGMAVARLGGGGGGRSDAVRAIRSTTSKEDLVTERAAIVKMLNMSHDSPNALPERLEMMKSNLGTIEEQLTAQGVDVSKLEPRPEWES